MATQTDILTAEVMVPLMVPTEVAIKCQILEQA